jgi:hypothetical protein
MTRIEINNKWNRLCFEFFRLNDLQPTTMYEMTCKRGGLRETLTKMDKLLQETPDEIKEQNKKLIEEEEKLLKKYQEKTLKHQIPNLWEKQ